MVFKSLIQEQFKLVGTKFILGSMCALYTKTAFIHDRFTQWKKAIEKFREHEASNMQVDKLLKLYLTFPVTTPTAKRSFSSLRHIKTYLRSTMTSCRSNNLYVHQDSLDL